MQARFLIQPAVFRLPYCFRLRGDAEAPGEPTAEMALGLKEALKETRPEPGRRAQIKLIQTRVTFNASFQTGNLQRHFPRSQLIRQHISGKIFDPSPARAILS